MKDIKIPSTKGNLDATIHEAETNKLAIICPGFLDSKDYTGLLELAKRLNERGYLVVRFDPTGVWESDGDISDYTITQYLKDIENVLKYMLQQKDYKHILLGGHSRGGQMSILYAARDPRISSVIGIMPSAGPIKGKKREDWKKTGYFGKRDLPFDREKIIEFNVPFNHVLDRDQYDAFGDIKKIKVPIILVAGELDELVPPEEVKKLYANANQPKKFIPIPKIGHDYRFNDDEVELVNKKILEKLKK